MEQGLEQGMRILINTCRELNLPCELVRNKAADNYGLTVADADNEMRQY